jgi:hypothetical protein
MIYVAIIVVTLFAALRIWKSIRISNMKKAGKRNAAALKARIDSLFTGLNLTYLELLAKSLRVRSELRWPKATFML